MVDDVTIAAAVAPAGSLRSTRGTISSILKVAVSIVVSLSVLVVGLRWVVESAPKKVVQPIRELDAVRPM